MEDTSFQINPPHALIPDHPYRCLLCFLTAAGCSPVWPLVNAQRTPKGMDEVLCWLLGNLVRTKLTQLHSLTSKCSSQNISRLRASWEQPWKRHPSVLKGLVGGGECTTLIFHCVQPFLTACFSTSNKKSSWYRWRITKPHRQYFNTDWPCYYLISSPKNSKSASLIQK